MSTMNSIELFSGAGGLALGLEMSGWRHKALVENNEHACSTIHLNESLNHPLAKDWKLYSDDVRFMQYNKLFKSIDMVAGGPPCQPFSLGGKHQSYKDHRDMFPEVVRAVRELQPKCFVFENVRGILRQSFSAYFSYILLQLTYPAISKRESEDWLGYLSRLKKKHTGKQSKDLSYKVVFRLLNAADYGIPQNRYRVFIVGFRSDLGKEWSFPKPTNSFDRLLWDQWVSGDYWDEHRISKKKRPEFPYRYLNRINHLSSKYIDNPPPLSRYMTVRDALHDLPDPKDNRVAIPNHEFRDGARPYPGHSGSVLDEPSKTLKAGAHGVPGGENMINYSDGTYRYYTVRESARLQAFPDNYIFSGSWSEAMRQIGNAVPVELAAHVGDSIYKQLKRN